MDVQTDLTGSSGGDRNGAAPCVPGDRDANPGLPGMFGR
jgi:hypothetical protein